MARVEPFISIVTRAHNRLEYTIRCVNAVRNNTLYPNYEHIIVSQGSTDGTVEWLNWIKKDMPNQSHFSRVRAFHPGKNLGSLGGTLYALEKIQTDLIVVLDNDMEVPRDWLRKMEHVWHTLYPSTKGLIAVMARRIGVTKTKKCNFYAHYNYGKMILSVWTTSDPGACFMFKRKSLLEHRNEMTEHLHVGRYGKTFKILEVEVTHMEGANLGGEGSYLQNLKYKPNGKKA